MRSVALEDGGIVPLFGEPGMSPKSVEHEPLLDPVPELCSNDLHELGILRERSTLGGFAHRARLEKGWHLPRERVQVLLDAFVRRVELALAQVLPELAFNEHEENPGGISRLDGPGPFDGRHPEQAVNARSHSA